MNKKSNKPLHFKATFKRLLTYFKPYRIAFIVIFTFIIVSTILSVFTPKLLGSVTTSIYESIKNDNAIDFHYLSKILIVLVILNMVSGLFYYVAQFMISSYAQKIILNLRMDVNEKLTRLPLTYYDKTSFGDFISRVTNDIGNVSSAFQESLTTFISSIVLIISILMMMIWINIYMTLVALLTLPVSMILAKIVVNKSQTYFKQKQSILGSLNGHVEETFSSLTTIKAFYKEEDSIDRFGELNNKLATTSIMAGFLSSVIMPLMRFVSNIGYVLLSVLGVILLLNGKIAIGNIQAFLDYSRRFNMPVSQVASISNLIQSTIASAERVFEVLDEEELDFSYTRKLPHDLKGNIRFNHVTFGYNEKTLMKDISLEVNSGETVAVIGPTGAGKTTLINLLMRFYDVQGGSITIDEVNIKDVDRADLRHQFGMVLQDTWLFKGTIYENIAYSKRNATKEEVIHAAKIAKAHHFIMTQPKGYDTIINEEASNISAGQKQLITIARAVLAKPKILILDEATSSVDTRTELLIKKGLDNLSKDKTTFIIAHRLSTIKNATKVILMEHGSIVKVGTYQTVVENRG